MGYEIEDDGYMGMPRIIFTQNLKKHKTNH